MTKGDTVMIRCPLSPRNIKASTSNPAHPALLSTCEIHCQRLRLSDGGSVLIGGEMDAKVKITQRNISTAHKSEEIPAMEGPGDSSFTMRMPMSSSENVRSTTCRSVFQTGSPARNRPPKAEGMDIPTMKRNAGKTMSTNVIPLPPLKWRIQAGTTLCETPAISLTKIMVNITNPRTASMEATREGR